MNRSASYSTEASVYSTSCLQEGGGASDFSIYVAGAERRPVLVNTGTRPTVGSRHAVSNTQARSQIHHAAETEYVPPCIH